jgi:predicted kinase
MLPIDNITEEVVEQVESGFSDSKLLGIDALIGDNWYENHPDRILGLPFEASGRFGKVIKYKGDINDVNKIDAPDNFIGNTKILTDPLASVSFDMNASAELLKPDVEVAVSDAIKNANVEVARIRKKKEKKIDEDALLKPVGEIKSFKETFIEVNPNITLEEVEVYVWYKTKIGQPLSKYYVSIFKPEMFSEGEDMTQTMKYEVSDEVVKSWVLDGLLFYHNGELLPSVEYLQGNMYDKKIKLDNEAEYIKTTYGEDVFIKQEAVLKNAFNTVYERRLTIGAGERSLVLLPISKFAKEFMITSIESIAENKYDGKFKIKPIKKSGSDFGKPDILGDIGFNEWKKTLYDEITLVDAFCWWLLNKNPDLKEPISHRDIILYYVEGKNLPSIKDKAFMTDKEVSDAKAKNEKLKSSTQREGERLFKQFLETEVTSKDKVRIETEWNINNNNYLAPDYDRIPIGFRMMKDEKIRKEKRDAVAFTLNNGTGVLSYDVGVGKTPSAIFSISAFIDAGYCKRPVVIVPNQVYKQFISEIKKFTPHIPVNEAYNLSEEYVENFRDSKGKIVPPQDATITVMTYEGFENIGFSEKTQDMLTAELYEILNQGGESEKTEKKKASFLERIETIVGKGLKKSIFTIEEFGFDFMCYDEAHKMKKVFTSVKGEAEEDEKGKMTRGKNPYVITSGSPSSIALRGFMINQYILRNNNYKNILLLTATPFTNSPLEIFSMLSMVAYEKLQNTGMNNLKTFFDTYVQASTQLVINSKLKPQFKQVILGFNNLISLQILIRRFILYKTGDELKIPRPKKYVLPYLKEVENGITILLGEDKKVETYISMTSKQKVMMEDIITYVETGRELTLQLDEDEFMDIEGDVDDGDDGDDGDDKESTTSVKDIEKEKRLKVLSKMDCSEIAIEYKKIDNKTPKWEKSFLKKQYEECQQTVDEDSLDENEKIGVRTIKGLNFSRNLALSPYLYPFSGMREPTYLDYVRTSPKLSYVMGCIQSVRDYHLAKNEPISGQVIYMDRGVGYFNLLKEYLVKEVGYKEHEIGIIKSGLPKSGTRSKEYIKNLFNGEIYNEKTKEFETVTDEMRIKVVIGSSTIKEGINLQKYGTVLYNCFIDWNPTDIQQLEGRIYRQGNKYNAVRIVNPLVIDSADIFIFQKLQEKTSRLNSIWSSDGVTNILKTDEFSPEELKYALIRDPQVIAELKIIEEKAKIDSELIGYNRQLEQGRNVISLASNIKYRFDQLIRELSDYRDFTPTGDMLNDAVKLVQITNELYKNQTDKEGKKILSSWRRRYAKPEELENISNVIDDEFSKPYWFTDFAVSTRDLKKFKTSYLDALKIDIDFSDAQNSMNWYLDTIKKDIEGLTKKKEELDSPNYKNQILEEVIAEKERQKITYTTLEQSIRNFNRLNYLLSDVKIPVKPKAEITMTCPPLDADGTRDISKEGIANLEKCLAKQPQTKDLHFSEKTGYLPERQMLHDEIVNNLFKEVKCVSKGQPIAIFTGGSPASGKSFFIKKNADYLQNESIFHLDADEIRAKLPEYEGWNANSTHLETQDIVNQILEKLGDGACRYDFIYDGTMNKAKKYFSLIKKVMLMGYKVYIIFMDIPYEEAKRRALERYKRTGRFVPMEVIDDFFTDVNGMSKGQAALDELKPLVDGYVVADGLTGNIIEKGGEGIPVSRSSDVYSEPVLEAAKTKPEPDNEEQKKPLDKPFIEKTINSLKLALKYSKGDDSKKIEKQIKSLQIALKYA